MGVDCMVYLSQFIAFGFSGRRLVRIAFARIHILSITKGEVEVACSGRRLARVASSTHIQDVLTH